MLSHGEEEWPRERKERSGVKREERSDVERETREGGTNGDGEWIS